MTLLLPRGGLTHVPVPTTKAALDAVITAKGRSSRQALIGRYDDRGVATGFSASCP